MAEETTWKEKLEALPPVNKDVAFHAMNVTQFLGAFNDNLYKQLMLLICAGLHLQRTAEGTAPTADYYQSIAFAVFSLPFVLFSGFAGFLSDRSQKRIVVILSKVAEIIVMTAGAVAFYSGSVPAMFFVLFMMGTQSAFFGPSKYGILPEMFRSSDLPYLNGVFVMTTFLAIVLGQAGAGYLRPWLGEEHLWLASLGCIVTAILGTATSLFIRATPIANPGLKFRISTLAIDSDTWKLIRKDYLLFDVLLITSVFWMIGGAMQQAINAFGKYQLRIDDMRTSLMLVSVAIGIAVGCVIAGKLSKGRIRFGIYKFGNFGIIATLVAMGLVGFFGPNREYTEDPAKQVSVESSDTSNANKVESTDTADADLPADENRLLPQEPPAISRVVWLSGGLLFLMGISAGMFTVPLQVFLQVRAPDQEKGRIIAAMNLANFVGIFFAAAVYFAVSWTIAFFEWPQAVHFWACAGVMAILFVYPMRNPE